MVIESIIFLLTSTKATFRDLGRRRFSGHYCRRYCRYLCCVVRFLVLTKIQFHGCCSASGFQNETCTIKTTIYCMHADGIIFHGTEYVILVLCGNTVLLFSLAHLSRQFVQATPSDFPVAFHATMKLINYHYPYLSQSRSLDLYSDIYIT